MTIIERIKRFNDHLIPDKVQLKYSIMSKTPFDFYRGTCHLFYEDLSKETALPVSPAVWICGDLHLENFGSYKGDNRLVYFDINDFDESVLAPVHWEILRVLTSILVAFESLGISETEAGKMCTLFLQSYGKLLAGGSSRYIERQTAQGIVRRFLKKVALRPEQKLIEERTKWKGDKLILSKRNSKGHELAESFKQDLSLALTEWMNHNGGSLNHYNILDVSFRVAGTGSLGVERYIFLLQHKKDKLRYRLLDMKQALPSSLFLYTPSPTFMWPSEADRLVEVQKMMQNVPPAHLHAFTFKGRSYLIQEMQPVKDRINFGLIEENADDISRVIEDMALVAASAHLRTTSRKKACLADELIDFGRSDTWHQPYLDYAFHYKKVVADNFQEFKAELIEQNKKISND